MSNQQITPPDKQLVRKWIEDWAGGQMKGPVTEDQLIVATQSAQWGADQELEWLLVWLRVKGFDNLASDLLSARRPNPLSLKEQALDKTTAILEDPNRALLAEVREALELSRRALESLDD